MGGAASSGGGGGLSGGAGRGGRGGGCANGRAALVVQRCGDAHQAQRDIAHARGRLSTGGSLSQQRGEIVGVEHAVDAPPRRHARSALQSAARGRVHQQDPPLGVHHPDRHIQPGEHVDQRVTLVAEFLMGGLELLGEPLLGALVVRRQFVHRPGRRTVGHQSVRGVGRDQHVDLGSHRFVPTFSAAVGGVTHAHHRCHQSHQPDGEDGHLRTERLGHLRACLRGEVGEDHRRGQPRDQHGDPTEQQNRQPVHRSHLPTPIHCQEPPDCRRPPPTGARPGITDPSGTSAPWPTVRTSPT